MKTKCGACGRQLESGETIDVAGQGPRCYSCFNRETANRLGIDFDEPQFQSIGLEDADGRPHTFRFRSMLIVTPAFRWSSSTASRSRGSRSGTCS